MLTPREREVFELFLRGTPNKVIAYDLAVAESTVKVHLNHIYRKLGVRNSRHAFAHVIKRVAEDGFSSVPSLLPAVVGRTSNTGLSESRVEVIRGLIDGLCESPENHGDVYSYEVLPLEQLQRSDAPRDAVLKGFLEYYCSLGSTPTLECFSLETLERLRVEPLHTLIDVAHSDFSRFRYARSGFRQPTPTGHRQPTFEGLLVTDHPSKPMVTGLSDRYTMVTLSRRLRYEHNVLALSELDFFRSYWSLTCPVMDGRGEVIYVLVAAEIEDGERY